MLLTKDEVTTAISIPAVLAYRQSDELLIELLKMEGIDIHEPGKILLTGKPGKKFITTNHVLLREREQLIIQNKTNPFWFDKFIENIEQQNPVEIQIVEDHLNLNLEEDSDIVDEAESTVDIFKKYIVKYKVSIIYQSTNKLFKLI